MSRKGIRDKLELRLSALEEEFHETLVAALERCKDGSAGVFLTLGKAEERGEFWLRLVWPEAKQLGELDEEISLIRAQLGMSEMKLAARFRELSNLKGENVPGGGKLAQQLLGEIHSGSLR